MAKKEKITELTRRNMVNAFYLLLEEKGLDQIGVKDVAARAGYHRSTFYAYFQDLSDLVHQEEDALIGKGLEQAVRSLTQEPDKFVEGSVSFYEENGKQFSLLLGERGDPAFAGRLKASLKPVVKKKLGSRAKGTGEDYVLEYVLSGLYGTLLYWFQRKDLSAKEVTCLITPLIHGDLHTTAE